MPAMFKDTARFKCLRSIRVVQQQHDPHHVLIVEHWDCEGDYKTYYAWRDRDGDMARALALLSSHRMDVWPQQIGFAAAAKHVTTGANYGETGVLCRNQIGRAHV